MAKASDNLFPYVHLVPAAAPASPAAGAERLYLDSADGKLKRKNSSGTVTVVEGGGGGGTGDAVWSAPSLNSPWANLGGAFANVGYRKDGQGFVHLKGIPTGGTNGSVIFTLPAGYRPAAEQNFATAANGGFGQINISASGVVVKNVGTGTDASLNGITFLAEL